jgi:hypothetical protein
MLHRHSVCVHHILKCFTIMINNSHKKNELRHQNDYDKQYYRDVHQIFTPYQVRRGRMVVGITTTYAISAYHH